MPTLAELQQSLQDFLLDKTAEAEQLTLETPQFSRHERLQIYHNAYRLRLIDALRNDYPALEKVVGEASFVNICSEFIAQHPSQDPSLRWLGTKLPEFLYQHEHWGREIYPAELAAFEWAQTMAFDAAESECPTLDELRNLQPEQWMSLQLEFQPSLQLLALASNAPSLWTAAIKDEDQVAPEVSTEKQDWLVWRENLQVVYRPLEKAEASALRAFMAQQNFAEVCGELCNWFEEAQVPMQAARYLQQWLQGGLISYIR